MTLRLIRLMSALLVVITTMAWAQHVLAAIVVNSEAFQVGGGGMSAPPISPNDGPSERQGDQQLKPRLKGILPGGGAGGSSPTSSGESANGISGFVQWSDLPPPPLVASLRLADFLFFPEPPVFGILNVPRGAHAVS